MKTIIWSELKRNIFKKKVNVNLEILSIFPSLCDEELSKINGGDFAGSLKHHRLKANLTQESLAEALWVDPHTVRNWECRRTSPKGAEIFNLCQILNIDFLTLWDPENHYR